MIVTRVQMAREFTVEKCAGTDWIEEHNTEGVANQDSHPPLFGVLLSYGYSHRYYLTYFTPIDAREGQLGIYKIFKIWELKDNSGKNYILNSLRKEWVAWRTTLVIFLIPVALPYFSIYSLIRSTISGSIMTGVGFFFSGLLIIKSPIITEHMKLLYLIFTFTNFFIVRLYSFLYGNIYRKAYREIYKRAYRGIYKITYMETMNYSILDKKQQEVIVGKGVNQAICEPLKYTEIVG